MIMSFKKITYVINPRVLIFRYLLSTMLFHLYVHLLFGAMSYILLFVKYGDCL